MSKGKAELFTGGKSVRLEDLPEEAWRVIAGEGGGQGEAAKLYAVVSWLYRCIDIRAGAVANMPWEIKRVGASGDASAVVMTQEDVAPEQFGWLDDLTGLLYRTEAAVALTGRAYWFRERNIMRTLNVRWLRPDSVRPRIDRDGLHGFTRAIGGNDTPFAVDDMVYFWLPDPYVEIGPAEHYPGKAALNAAGVLRSLDVFLTGYFDRGMVKATLLTYENATVTEIERSRVREWWQRSVMGLKHSFNTEVLRGEVKPVVVGEGLKDLQNTALTAEQRESICTALGVPQSKVTANAANFATANQDARAFIQDTIAPECRWIAAVINRQLLGPMGLRLEFKPDELSVMQEDETARANSLKLLVDAGMSLEMALAVLGYDLPEGIELREPVAETPPQLLPFTGQQQPQPAGAAPDDGERIEETARFVRWARKRANPDPEQFESMVLSHADKVALLEGADSDDAPFRDDHADWQGYP